MGNVILLIEQGRLTLSFLQWCGHCQELAPKWERLAEDYADQTTKYLIAEVDCTATPQVETWCEDTFEVEGFPTLLFGDPGRGGALLEEYLDERDYETLAAFSAQMFATPLCNVDHMDGCSDEIKQQLIRYMSMTTEDIDAEIERIETEMDQLEEAFDENMDELQEQYDNMATDHQISVSAISKELKWMLEIKDSKIATS